MTIPTVLDAHEHAISALAAPGDWLTGEQRVDVWRQARDAATHPLDVARRAAVTPAAVAGEHEATAHYLLRAPESCCKILVAIRRWKCYWLD